MKNQNPFNMDSRVFWVFGVLIALGIVLLFYKFSAKSYCSNPKFSSMGELIAGNAIMFRDETSGARSWLWNFGDGNTSTKKEPSYIFRKAGTYIVTLEVNDGKCETQRVLEIKEGVSGNAMLPRIISNSVATAGKPIKFSFESPNPVTTQEWNFGENFGAVDNKTPHPTHVYKTPGDYIVTLTVNGDSKNVVSKAITVFPQAASSQQGGGSKKPKLEKPQLEKKLPNITEAGFMDMLIETSKGNNTLEDYRKYTKGEDFNFKFINSTSKREEKQRMTLEQFYEAIRSHKIKMKKIASIQLIKNEKDNAIESVLVTVDNRWLDGY